MEFRLRTATGMLATRPGGAANPPAHIDELADVMADSRRWNLGKPIVHIVDREATRVLDPLNVVKAEWFLLTNVPTEFSAATVARWYARRWRLESNKPWPSFGKAGGEVSNADPPSI